MFSDGFKKKLTPSFIRSYQRKLRDEKAAAEYSGLSNSEVFEKIYEEQKWGHSGREDRKYSSGDGTRDQEIVSDYIQAITEFLSRNPDLKTGLDLGCGDFSVGVNFCGLFDTYKAADVAKNVIAENKKIYRDENVEFFSTDLSNGKIPKSDVIFVRQVLQHLSNSEIEKFVKNIHGKFKCLVLTESISKSVFFSANKDIITGPGIRIHKKSGVVLEKHPFNLKCSKINVIFEVSKGREVFITKVYFA